MTTTIGSLDLNAFSDLYSDSNQYFWFESDSSATYGAGAHVTLVPDTTFISNPTGQNILMNTDGISIRNGLLPMMTLDNNSLDFNIVDTVGNTYTNAASFGISSTIGLTDGTQSYLYEDYHSLQMIDKDGNTYLHISNLLDKNGLMNDVFYADGSTTKFVLAVTAKNIGSATYNVYVDDVLITSGITKTLHDITFSVAPTNGSVVRVSYEPSNSHNINAYTLGLRKSGVAIGKLSVVEGKNNKASASNTHAEGENTSAYTDNSHAEGLNTSAGGIRTDAAAHAEGKNTSAYGTGAHAEGVNTHASGWASHAEGASTKTFNPSNGYEADYAHAEGNDSVVCSDCSHASGLGTNAYRAVQTVIGKYNEIDTYAGDPYDGTPSYDDDIVHKRYGKNVFIIGNGADDNNRSNALTVDWQGNVVASGGITDGSGNVLSDKANTSDIPTKTSDLTNDSNFVGFESGTATAGSVTWEYRKWADGTLEMWGRGLTTLNINTAVGNIYTTAGEYDIAVPSFVDSVDFVTGELSGGGWVDVTGFNVPPKIRLYAPTAYTSTNRYLRYYLKGTWS